MEGPARGSPNGSVSRSITDYFSLAIGLGAALITALYIDHDRHVIENPG